MEAQIERMKIDGTKVAQEEQRKTMAEQMKAKQQLANYEDQLARKRYDDQLNQQVGIILKFYLFLYLFYRQGQTKKI